MTTDLSKPLIAVISPNMDDAPGAVIVIDGWHRIKKAHVTNHPHDLEVHLLSRHEEMSCWCERIL